MKDRPEIAIGFLAATVLWLGVVAWGTSYAPTNPEKEACYQAAAKSGRSTEECKAFWEKVTSDPVAAFTLVLAFSTVGLWVATIGLYSAGKREISHFEGTAIRELRAYVYLVISARIYPPKPDKPNRYAISLSVINSGKSWARDVRVSMDVVQETLDKPITDDPYDLAELHKKETEPMVLGPGERLDLQFHEVLLTQLPALTTRQVVLYYAANVTYEDVLTEPSVTRQTQLSRKLSADIEGIGHVSFGWMPTHNCADDDCPNQPLRTLRRSEGC